MVCNVQDQLLALDGKLNYLLDRTSPPTYRADDTLQDASGPNPLVKPTDAIGLVIECSIPSWAGKQLGKVTEYPHLGWIILGTADGYLPSIPIRHTPQVILPLDTAVYDVAVNTITGVAPQVRWLRPPT
jgi:hypothetical protein